MNSSQLAILAIIIGPLFGLVGIVYAAIKTSRTQGDTNDINRIQLLLDGYAGRISQLESEVKTLTANDTASKNEIAKMRRILQKWFRDLKAAWPSDQPMPMPSDEDMEVLGLR